MNLKKEEDVPVFPSDDYMKLEYVQWNSSAAAFITPIYDDGSYGDIGYEIDLMPIGSQGNYVTALIGTNIWGIRNVDSNYHLSLGGNQYVTLSRQNNVRYYIDADSSSGDITVNGTLLGTVNCVHNFRNYIVLGGYRQGNTLNAVARNVRVYEYILKKSDGGKICWFVPAMRLADGEIGFWDYISNTFITNSASGTVTAGTYGTIPAQFSVSATDKVYFSQGNLQYHCLNDIWRFAEHQYDIIGTANTNISPSYDGWIDLFGWGTSGYDNTADDVEAVRFHPYDYENTNLTNWQYNRFGYGPSTNMSDKNLTGTSANYDWGVYNRISNGGDKDSMWRTLTRDEWYYLINTRANASILKAKCTIDGVRGLLLMPDNYTNTSGLTIATGTTAFNSNVFTTAQFALLEADSCVFLPAAGYRDSTSLSSVGTSDSGFGLYWSTTYYNVNDCMRYVFRNGGDIWNSSWRYHGLSVRLVRNIK